MGMIAIIHFPERVSDAEPSYFLGGDVTVRAEFRDDLTDALTAVTGVVFVVTKADGSILSPPVSVVTEQAGVYRCVVTPDQAGLWAIEVSSTSLGATNDRREFFMVSESIAPSVIGPSAVTSVNGFAGPSVTLDAGSILYAPAITGAGDRTIRAKLGDLISARDIGAECDGVTNDYEAVQYALDTIGDRALFFPGPVYTGNSPPLILDRRRSTHSSGRAPRALYGLRMGPVGSSITGRLQQSFFISERTDGEPILKCIGQGFSLYDLGFYGTSNDLVGGVSFFREDEFAPGNAIEDIDSYVTRCDFWNLLKGVVTRGRGIRLIDNSFESSNFGIDLDFPDVLPSGGFGQNPDDAFRAIVIDGNRFHSIDVSCINNTGANRTALINLQCVNNHVDGLTNRFFSGAARRSYFNNVVTEIRSLLDNPSPDASGGIAYRFDEVDDVQVDGIVSGRISTAADTGDKQPAELILFREDANNVRIGASLSYARFRAVRFSKAATNIHIHSSIVDCGIENTARPAVFFEDASLVGSVSFDGMRHRSTSRYTPISDNIVFFGGTPGADTKIHWGHVDYDRAAQSLCNIGAWAATEQDAAATTFVESTAGPSGPVPRRADAASHEFYTSGTYRAAIDANGCLLVGASAAASFNGAVRPLLQVANGFANQLGLLRHSANATAGQVVLAKSRGTTPAAFTAVVDGDDIFDLLWEGADGTGYQIAARMRAEVNGAVSTGVVPGRITMSLADASGALTDVLRLDGQRNVVMGTEAVARSATDGFLYIPTMAGTPTGTPTAFAGRAALVVDSSSGRLYVHDGTSWRYSTLT